MTTTIATSIVGTGAPAVDVTVVWTAAGTVTIERGVGGVWTPLRTSPATLVADTVTVRDYEVPDNTAVTYRTYPVGAAIGTAVTSGSVTVPDRGVWLIHPGKPDTLSVQVIVQQWPTWTRAVTQDVAYPLGTPTPVVVTDVRQARTGALTVIVQSLAAATALDALLADTRVMLVNANRYPAPYVWVAVGEETWEPLEVKVGAATVPMWGITLPLTEIVRPSITSSGEVTWIDVSARYATFDLLAAQYGTFDAFWTDAATWTT